MIELLTIAAADAEASQGLMGTFGIDGPKIFASIVNFLIVAGALYFLAFKPVLATMDERQQKIADGLQYAEEMKSKLAEAERDIAEMRRKASEDIQVFVKDSRDQAKVYYDQQVQAAAQRVEDMIRQASEACSLDRERMLSEVRQEIAQLVVATTSKVLGQELSDTDRKRFNSSAVELLHGSN